MKPQALIALTRKRRLVLGSGSARRSALLEKAGIRFRQVVPKIDESVLPDENPFDAACRLARKKAQEVARDAAHDEIVLGGDTVVVLDGILLGKPRDEQDAFGILTQLSGRRHIVGTALALADRRGVIACDIEKTAVAFNSTTPEQIRQYIASQEPMDKAGAYGIQGMGAFLVDSIEGNLDTVIGLPLTLLDRLAGDLLCRIGNDTDCE